MTQTTRIAPTRPQNDPLAASRRLRVCFLMALLRARPADPFDPERWDGALRDLSAALEDASAALNRQAKQGHKLAHELIAATTHMRAMRATHKG